MTIGIVLSLLMRFHLVWPAAHLPFVRGGIMTPEQYLALVTMHGTIMVFFVLTTAPQNALRELFPSDSNRRAGHGFSAAQFDSRFWLTFIAFLCLIAAFVVPRRRADQRLDGLSRRSAVWARVTGPGEGIGSDDVDRQHSDFLRRIAAERGEFHLDDHRLARAGMTLMRMPLTVWAWFVTAILEPAGVFACCSREECCCCSTARPGRVFSCPRASW